MFQLSCENAFCIYQKQGNCIYINVEEDTLNNLKEKHLRNLQDLA